LRHMLQNLLHQRAELGRTRKIPAIAGEIDAGENDLAIAARAEPAHLHNRFAHGHRARIAAAIRDDAEGAAVVAAILHLYEGARAPSRAVDEIPGRLRHRHMSLTATFSSAARPKDDRAKTSRCWRQACALIFSSLPNTNATSGMSAKVLGSVCAAQPVTTMGA